MNLLDLLYNFNCKIVRDSSLMEKLQVRRCLRMLVKFASNTLLPIILKKSTQEITGNSDSNVIVSLTTFPKRINHVWMTIETMMCQTCKPQAIILWLSKEQFPNEVEDLPDSLRNQIKRGLQVRFLDGDVRSHKKYYYAFHEFNNKYVVTIDDDMFFPTYFIESMCKTKKSHPNDIIASFGSRYTWDADQGKIAYLLSEEVNINESYSDALFGTGGGTLFEPSKFIDKMDDLETIFGMCPTEDDMYINALMKVSGINTTFHIKAPLLSIYIPNNQSLMQFNGSVGADESNNTRQVNNIINHMSKKFGRNPFLTK